MNDPSVVIHLVTHATASLLDNVEEDVFDNPVSPTLLREYLSNVSNALFVATIHNCVVGMATGIVYVHPDKPRSLFINEVGVSVRYHRHGIGRQLITALLAWGRKQGCVEAWVAAEANDTVARSFYRATGGVEEDQQAVVYTYPLALSPEIEGEV